MTGDSPRVVTCYAFAYKELLKEPSNEFVLSYKISLGDHGAERLKRFAVKGFAVPPPALAC